MNGNAIWGFIALVIVIAGGWFLLRGTPAQAPATTEQTPAVTDTTTTTSTTTTTVPSGVTVFYTASGFSPKSVSVPLGTTVSFVNQTSNTMWIASAPHPTHQGYDGTTKDQHCAAGYAGPKPFDECSVGAAFSFIFTKVGTWSYHNHGNPADKGTVTVTAAATSTPL